MLQELLNTAPVVPPQAEQPTLVLLTSSLASPPVVRDRSFPLPHSRAFLSPAVTFFTLILAFSMISFPTLAISSQGNRVAYMTVMVVLLSLCGALLEYFCVSRNFISMAHGVRKMNQDVLKRQKQILEKLEKDKEEMDERREAAARGELHVDDMGSVRSAAAHGGRQRMYGGYATKLSVSTELEWLQDQLQTLAKTLPDRTSATLRWQPPMIVALMAAMHDIYVTIIYITQYVNEREAALAAIGVGGKGGALAGSEGGYHRRARSVSAASGPLQHFVPLSGRQETDTTLTTPAPQGSGRPSSTKVIHLNHPLESGGEDEGESMEPFSPAERVDGTAGGDAAAASAFHGGTADSDESSFQTVPAGTDGADTASLMTAEQQAVFMASTAVPAVPKLVRGDRFPSDNRSVFFYVSVVRVAGPSRTRVNSTTFLFEASTAQQGNSNSNMSGTHDFLFVSLVTFSGSNGPKVPFHAFALDEADKRRLLDNHEMALFGLEFIRREEEGELPSQEVEPPLDASTGTRTPQEHPFSKAEALIVMWKALPKRPMRLTFLPLIMRSSQQSESEAMRMVPVLECDINSIRSILHSAEVHMDIESSKILTVNLKGISIESQSSCETSVWESGSDVEVAVHTPRKLGARARVEMGQPCQESVVLMP